MLVILIIILIFCLSILFCPIGICTVFDGKLKSVNISFLFFKFNIYDDDKKNEPGKKADVNKNSEVRSYFNSIKKLVKLIKPTIVLVKEIFEILNFKEVYIFIRISASDAKNSAISYSIIQSIFEVICCNILPSSNKNVKIKAYPCFYSDKTIVKSRIKFDFVGIKLINLLLKSFFRLAKIAKSFMRE